MIRRATAIWNGTGLEGKGSLTSTSGVLQQTPYSTAARFENEDGKAGTNPEELIGAAHAGCFSMALSFQLSGAGFTPDELKTEAAVRLDKVGEGYEVTSIKLTLEARIADISDEQFQQLADAAKRTCPISKALSAVDISLDAKLV
ncbi:MAG TPA: OsmC family protein [Sphingobacteriaceae bacterium]